VEIERLPLEARALQARARRALAIGEIDQNVHAFVTMETAAILRWCWAEGAGVKTSAWIGPNGQVNSVEYGQHWNWIKANAASLAAQGVADEVSCQQKPAQVAMKMMQAGWIRYSGGVVMTLPMPNAAQAAAIDGLIQQAGVSEGFSVQFFIEGPGARGEVPVQDVLTKGSAKVMAELAQTPEGGEPPLGQHRLADAGGGTDGPFQHGDGQDVQNSYMESIQDGSTAPIERGIEFMPQDLQPEVWWQRNLLDYLEKNYPGKAQPGAQSDLPASGTGPGQQFASAARIVVTAANQAARHEREILAQVGDPSDTDGQHDQVNEDAVTTPVDPAAQFNRGEKGLGVPTKETRTRLGERWHQRRSDKGVEKQIIQMEKGHLEPDEIVQELREEGIPPKVIDETYENREKNLFKVVEVGG
jgi:hypothetical protein